MSAGIRLTLGPVGFGSFELPERIGFGGGQRVAVHQLPGGMRVVDAMGRDDARVTWSGAFSGPDAAERMRLLDALRVAGMALPLSWDAFFFTVVITELAAEYSTPWWIPYRLVCTMVQDEAAAVVAAVTSLVTLVAGDLAQAAAYTDVSAPQAALAVDGATTRGTADYAAALSSVQGSSAGINAQIDAAGEGLAAADLPTAVSSAGTLAQLGVARGYVARAGVNLANAST